MLSHEELEWELNYTYRCLPCVFRSSEDVSLELQLVVDAHGGEVLSLPSLKLEKPAPTSSFPGALHKFISTSPLL